MIRWFWSCAGRLGRYAKKMPPINEKLESSALVDHSGLIKTVTTLTESFCLLEFLDLCTLLEGIILHDQILVVRTDSEHGGQGLLKTLYDEKVLIDYQITESLAYPTKKKEPPKEGHKPARRVAKCSTEDSWYETARIYAAELESNHSALPFNRQQPFYNRIANPKKQQAICDLYSRNETLSKDLKKVRKALTIETNNYIRVPIPPVPLLVFNKARSFADMIESALEIREDFSVLRRNLRQLRSSMADQDIAPQSKQKEITKWAKSWATLDKYKEAATVDIATSVFDNINGNEIGEEFSSDTFDINKLVTNAINMATKSRSRWRVKTMHRAAKNYLSHPDQDLQSNIENLFGYKLNACDLRKFDEWVKGRKKLNKKSIIDPRKNNKHKMHNKSQ